jgi:molecular chaperone DnaK
MRAEAEKFSEEDKAHKNLIEARNMADNAIYTAEKALKDLDEKLPEDLKQQIRQKVNDVRAILDSEDINTVNKTTEALKEEVSKLGAAAYQYSAPQSGKRTDDTSQGTPPSQDDHDSRDTQDGDVIDGEFKEE